MKQHKASISLSESEILAVFNALGLSTQEKRDRILALTDTGKLDFLPKSPIVSWLSNNSEPVSLMEVKNAKLEEPS
jgi:hypothetical protein